ncbi:MAG: CHAT domain-containing protein [Bdellovibrio bacteriovorus]
MESCCVDLLIRIGRAEGAQYPVEAVVEGAAQYFGGLLALDQEALRAQSLDVAAYGTTLSEALFSRPIQRAYDQALARARERCGGRLRLRLQIDPDASELEALRWERLILRQDARALPAAVAMETPFSRYTALEQDRPAPLGERPVRVLIAVANPDGLDAWSLAPVDVEGEVASLWDGLSTLASPASLAIAILPGRSGLSPSLTQTLSGRGARVLPGVTGIAALSDLMRQFHVVHLIAHGAFRPGAAGSPGSTRLLLESPDGSADLVTDDELAARWGAATPLPRLVYLAACESAARDEATTQAFVGLGPKLVAAGVPAVVAMQDRMPMEASKALTRRFFQSLLRHGVVDQALNEARWVLYERRSLDWSIPVLSMRLAEGRLLAADPLREAVQAMVAWSREGLLGMESPPPIEVIRAPASADAATLARLGQAEEAGYEIEQIARELLLAPNPQQPPCVVLLGGEGMGKSIYLRRLVGNLAEEALQGAAGVGPIPLLLDLMRDGGDEGAIGAARGRGTEELLCAALRRFWPELLSRRFHDLWTDPKGPTLVVLIDSTNALAGGDRQALFQGLSSLARRGVRHRFLVVCDPGQFHEQFTSGLPVTDFLVVKPLSFPRVETYLSSLGDPAGEELGEALRQHRLFDLAGIAWLLFRMLEDTRAGRPPRSRTAVLAGYLDSALGSLPSRGGIRGRARESLRALAQELQFRRCRSLPLERALEVLDPVRHRREYGLLEMLDTLVEARLLTRVGQDRIQFPYPGLQAYCCADALRSQTDWRERVDDIAATLGRLSRLRWWTQTLILLAGMTDDLDTLAGTILHGSSAGQDERVLLAVRCVEENADAPLDPLLREQLVAALLRLANPDYEPRVQVRTRAVHAIHRLQDPATIPHLVRIAFAPARINWLGERVVEYSPVRLAAIAALRSLGPPALAAVRTERPVLAGLLEDWIGANVAGIERHLIEGDEQVRPVAAFLLAMLRRPEADDRLIEQFHRTDTGQATSWAITDSLSLVDPARVAKEALLPYIDPGSGAPRRFTGASPRLQRDRRRQIAYLIGRLKLRDPWARRYLDLSLRERPDVALKGYAIRAFGDLLDTGQKDLLERLALGDFTGIATGRRWAERDLLWLRQVAVETLGLIGDPGTLERLRRQRRADQPWTPELELALFRTAEEISSRAWESTGAETGCA